jgi:hypothetical protein
VAYQSVPMLQPDQKSAVAADSDKVRVASVFARMGTLRRYSHAIMRREHLERFGPPRLAMRGRPLPDRALLPGDRVDWRKSESVLAGNGVESLLRENMLPGCVDVAKAPLQR